MTEKVIKMVNEIRQSLTSILTDNNYDKIRPWYDMLEEIQRHIFDENMKLQIANQQIDILKSKLACEELLSQMWKTEVENLAERHNNLKTAFNARHAEDQNR